MVTSPFDGNIIAGADAVARHHGFVTVVMDTELDETRDESAVETLLDRQVDGLMYVTVGLRPLHVPPSMLRVPSVLANCFDDRPEARRSRGHSGRSPWRPGGRQRTCWSLATGTSRSSPA